MRCSPRPLPLIHWRRLMDHLQLYCRSSRRSLGMLRCRQALSSTQWCLASSGEGRVRRVLAGHRAAPQPQQRLKPHILSCDGRSARALAALLAKFWAVIPSKAARAPGRAAAPPTLAAAYPYISSAPLSASLCGQPRWAALASGHTKTRKTFEGRMSELQLLAPSCLLAACRECDEIALANCIAVCNG